MPIVESEFALSRDPRLAAQLADHATSAVPAWLWSADGSRILWANAVGAAIFGAATTSECTTRRFDPGHQAVAEIARLAATLPSSGPPRLERLRGFGASFGRTLTCVCTRFALFDGAAAVLVVSTEQAGPPLTLRERVSRLISGRAEALVVFAPDGTLLAATKAAQDRFAGTPTWSRLGVAGSAAEALSAGSASGASEHGSITVERLGRAVSAALAVTFGPEPGPAAVAAGQAAANEGPEPAASSAPSAAVEVPMSVPALKPLAETAPAVTAPPSGQGAPPEVASRPSPPPPRSAVHGEPVAERRHPLRFVWQMNADGRFVVGSDEFTELMGPQTTAAFGRLWTEVAAELKLDPEQRVAHAVATRETWSGITVLWPVDEGGERLPVELSGLPVFDRERQFRGYRGFGVCRDITRINQLTHARRERPIGFIARPESPPQSEEAATAPQRPVMEAATAAALAEAELTAPPPVAAAAAEQPAMDIVAERPAMESVVEAPPAEQPAVDGGPATDNVVLFRSGTTEPKAPSLSPIERNAFRELAEELTARLGAVREAPGSGGGGASPPPRAEQAAEAETAATVAAPPAEATPPLAVAEERCGGAVAGVEQTAAGAAATPAVAVVPLAEPTVPLVEAAPAEAPLLDRIPVGVLIYQGDRLLYANRHFLELTGYTVLDALTAAGGLNKLVVEPAISALAQGGSVQVLSLVTGGGERSEVEGRLFAVPWGEGSALALILTNGEAAKQRRATALSLGAAENEIRELAARLEAARKSEEELRGVAREAQRAAAAKAEFVGKVSHEIRTPLNAITGFTEVMMAERFGPIGNERYREYLKDVHAAGMHLVALLNDLLDLSKIETGQLGLNFANVSLNELTQQCVGIMQPQASRARIIIRTALAPALPQVVADERSLRQIVLNLLSNSIKFTGPGGQVIVSTAFADSGEAVLRVRDTGIGMSEKDIEAALEPFRQTATSGSWGSGGTGLGLPLTKALAEANRARFSIKSAPNAGTLVEVTFPPTRVAAQ